jgi:hypothetical protein
MAWEIKIEVDPATTLGDVKNAVTDRVYFARIQDEAEQKRLAEARRKLGGRPRKLALNHINGGQAMARELLAKAPTMPRKDLVREVVKYLHESGVYEIGNTTVIRRIVEPVRGIRRKSTKWGRSSRNRF